MTMLKCSNCGKEIKIGEKVYLMPGLIYTCCSPACLLHACSLAYVETNTGQFDEDNDEE